MTSIPLDRLSLRPSHHLSALWWLGLLYRRPAQFRHAIESIAGRVGRLTAAAALYAHGVPLVLLASIAGRIVLFGLLQLSATLSAPDAGVVAILLWHGGKIAAGIATGIAGGITVGIIFGIADGIAFGIAVAIAGGIVIGIAGGFALAITGGFAFGIAGGVTFGIVGGIALGIALGIGIGIAGGIVFGIAEGIAEGIVFGIAGVISLLRAYYLPVHLFFVWPAVRAAAYGWHPVAWDDLCAVPFPGLCRLLAALAETDRWQAGREFERLIDRYPSQQMEALKAVVMLTARAAGASGDLAGLEVRVARLPEGEQGCLRDVPALRRMVAEVAQRQRRLDTVSVPAFREPLAVDLVRAIEDFKGQVSGLRYPIGSEFRAAADAWLAVARRQQEEARRVLETAPAAQVFRAGDPVDKEREAFIPRLTVIAELQGQVTLATGCPGLLLYGRRRMGKSTLIRNAEPFLPRSIRVARLSMQDPGAFTSLVGLLATITGAARQAAGLGVDGEPGNLTAFYRDLTRINSHLNSSSERIVLAIDEYENIDAKIGENVLPRNLLSVFRESIQNHRRIVWLFAGSHAIEEMVAADWPSAFVSLRTIELPSFTEPETRLLLTEPVAQSSLWGQGEVRRPRFEPAFWGEDGIERIHAETDGWPHLVQLVAETVVELINLRGQKAASPALLDEALTSAVTRGDIVLRQLVRGECSLPGEWAYLEGFRASEAQSAPDEEAVRRSLRRRMLIAESEDGWRMRVPLMRRWLIARG